MVTFLHIPSKPSSPISFTYFPSIPRSSTSSPTHLIIFLNGLGLPAISWLPCISILHNTLRSCPPILTYDRFGQGLTTSRDPIDGIPGKENGHDFLDVISDLHEIILTIALSKLGLNKEEVESGKLRFLFVGASIGANIVRLYTQYHSRVVAGLVLLDSNIANVNYSDIWPNPDAPGFDPTTVVSEDCTLEMYREHRTKLCSMFDLNVKNSEGLNRANSPALLPLADGPKLVGVDGRGPWLTVAGHDPETFAELSLQMMGIPKSLTMKLTNT
jgi:pimeloyl-ACP methyl ester carboxylesterase